MYLHKDSEENDHYCGSNEELLPGEVIKQEDQRKGDCPSEATVGNDELVFKGDGIHTELVHNGGQKNNS